MTGILSLAPTESGVSLRSSPALSSGLRLTREARRVLQCTPTIPPLACPPAVPPLTKISARRPLHNLHLVYCHPLLLTLYAFLVQIHFPLLRRLISQICLVLPSQIPTLSAPADLNTGLTYLVCVLEATRLSLSQSFQKHCAYRRTVNELPVISSFVLCQA